MKRQVGLLHVDTPQRQEMEGTNNQDIRRVEKGAADGFLEFSYIEASTSDAIPIAQHQCMSFHTRGIAS